MARVAASRQCETQPFDAQIITKLV